MAINSRTSKSFATLGLASAALLAFTACGSDEEPKPAETTTVTASEAAPSSASSAASDNEATSSASASDTPSSQAGAASDDQVFKALDAVEEKYPNGIVTGIDREDDDSKYEFTIIDGDDEIEVYVDQQGNFTGEEKETVEADDKKEATDAKIDVRQALESALGEVSDQSIDDVDLDDHQGKLAWEIEFDLANGSDGDEIYVDAVSGEVMR